jgi:hypothetical protein
MKAYDTLSEAIKDLQSQGYTYDFNLLPDGVACQELDKQFGTESFQVKEVYRFEGMSSEDDSSVLYVIETGSGVKGTLVDAYGTYSESLSAGMIEKMRIR